MKFFTLKKPAALIFSFLLLGMAFFFFSSIDKKGVPSGFASEPGLYVHAVSSSADTEAWQKWQSVHDKNLMEEDPEEKYFFLPSSAGKRSADVYNGFDREVMLNGVKIAPSTTKTVPYEPGAACSVAVGGVIVDQLDALGIGAVRDAGDLRAHAGRDEHQPAYAENQHQQKQCRG